MLNIFKRSISNYTIGSNFRNSKNNRPYRDTIKTIILDNSGTCLDPFVIAQAVVYKHLFREQNINISIEEARAPMGIRKDLHIAKLLQMPHIQYEFQKLYGRPSEKRDIDNFVEQLTAIQLKIIPQYCHLIPTVLSTMETLRKQNIKFSSSGFTTQIINSIQNTLDNKLYFDTIMTEDDFSPEDLHLSYPPKPFMIWGNLQKLNAWPIESVVKVDDTLAGIQEGLNAGCWSVGITDYSTYMNINSVEEWDLMDEEEKLQRRQYVRQKILNESGAHYVIQKFNELLPVITDINHRLSLGEKP